MIRTPQELESQSRFPFYLKSNSATASTAVWRVRTIKELKSRNLELVSQALRDGKQEFVVQEAAEGLLERTQALFDRGKLIAIHAYRQVAEALGGGDIAKLNVSRSVVSDHVERPGEQLQWHGALSLGYVFQEDRQVPLFIDANPRLVEPMNAVLSGVNLADILVQVSTGEPVAMVKPAADQSGPTMLLMGLLSAAAARNKRLDVIIELMRAIAGRGLYADRREELLPVHMDFKCLFPLLYALLRLLLKPESAS